MIICPVCHSENDSFATVCTKCKGFLQNRVPNLNLFETAWGVIESPRRTFHVITLAEHKNYAFVLFSLFGVSLTFTSFWYLRIGDRFESLMSLVGWAIGIGIVSGCALAILLTALYHLSVKWVGGTSSFRSSLGLLAYSLVPVAASLFAILPIELLTFGMYLFTWNPHPYTIKPFSYVALVGFDIVVGLWTLVLALIGTMVGHQISFVRALFAVGVALAALAGAFVLAPKAVTLFTK